MRNRAKHIFWAALGTVFLGVLVYGFLPDPVPVDLATVNCGPMQVTVDAEGKTRVRERYVVSAPLAGRLRRVELHPGDPVKAGQTVLASLDPGTPALLDERSRAEAEARAQAAEASRRRATSEEERAQARLEHARTELARAKELARREDLSQQALQNAELAERTARAELDAARSAAQVAQYELRVARAALLYVSGDEREGLRGFVLRAPVDGVVLRVLLENAGFVPGGTPILEVADPGDLEIVVDLLSADAVKVRAGRRVHLEHFGGERALEGRVRRVEPSGFTKISALGIEEQRVNVIIDPMRGPDSEEEWASLGDGYRVEARIVIWERDAALKAPASALFREGNDWALFVVSEGRARLRPVGIGARNGLEVEVLRGVAEGDVVVTHPSDKVADGVAVAARR